MDMAFEKRLAEKKVKADARKAVKDWYKYHTVDINDILKGMGYSEESGSLYKFTKSYYTGICSFWLRIDTYGLIIGNDRELSVEVCEK